MIRILVLLLLPVLLIGQEGGKVVTGSIRVTQDRGTPTLAVGKNGSGDYHRVYPGDNVTIANDTITAVGGGNISIPYDELNPYYGVGINSSGDTITDVLIDSFYIYQGGQIQVFNVALLPSDSLTAMRGSHMASSEDVEWTKSVNAGVTDTLDIDVYGDILDFSETDPGTFQVSLSNEEAAQALIVNPLQLEFYFPYKIFHCEATISLSSSADTIDTVFALYLNGFQIETCTAEFTTLGGGETHTARISCILPMADEQEIDIRVKNASGSNTTYTVKRAGLNMHQIAYSIIYYL